MANKLTRLRGYGDSLTDLAGMMGDDVDLTEARLFRVSAVELFLEGVQYETYEFEMSIRGYSGEYIKYEWDRCLMLGGLIKTRIGRGGLKEEDGLTMFREMALGVGRNGELSKDEMCAILSDMALNQNLTPKDRQGAMKELGILRGYYDTVDKNVKVIIERATDVPFEEVEEEVKIAGLLINGQEDV